MGQSLSHNEHVHLALSHNSTLDFSLLSVYLGRYPLPHTFFFPFDSIPTTEIYSTSLSLSSMQVWDLRESESKSVVDMVDPTLQSYDQQEAVRLVDVALLCTQASPAQRPSMSRIVAILTGDVELEAVAIQPGYIKAFQFGDYSSAYSAYGSTPMLAPSTPSTVPNNLYPSRSS